MLKIKRFQKKRYYFLVLILTIIILFCIFILPYLHSQKVYIAKQLSIEEIQSKTDIDMDKIDDYTDIMLGAREYINSKSRYKSKYYDGYGVCTDVIWRAFDAVGYSLKDLLDNDIAKNLESYPPIDTPDSNIDFRRVRNLNIFFSRNAEILETELTHPEEWQAGDIVIYPSHIVICSDKRNKDGFPFIIHHDNFSAREANDISSYKIIGHFRWTK